MGPIDQPDWNEYTCAYLDQFAVYNELHDQRRRRCHGGQGAYVENYGQAAWAR